MILVGRRNRPSGPDDAPLAAKWRRRLSPPQLFVASFLLLIMFGTAGLLLLPGLYTDQSLGVLDALFTATSAACVTGLIVVDTATHFTPLGQAFLLLLIQLGGLGLVTLSTLIIIALGRRLSVVQETATGGGAMVAQHIDVLRLTRNVVLFTAACEAAGALLLLVAWAPNVGVRAALWPAVFHSVSAFCNAGFSIFSDSLVGVRLQPLPLLTIMALVVVGGIGFLTMEELFLRSGSRRRLRRRGDGELIPRLSLHSRIALTTTAVLLLGGWILFALFEWNLGLAGMPEGARVINALFMSVTARTAGFNTISYGDASAGTSFLTILLMFVGGSPGSMAGGVKTTTFALLALLAWSRLAGRRRTSLLGRTVPEETVQRAVGLAVVALGVLTAAIFFFVSLEMGAVRHADAETEFLSLMFEAVSAFNTVGLSMGVTPELSPAGRVLTIILMYAGRVGPLTFAAAIALRVTDEREFRYAHEDVVIG
jgi:trk system potassium uptake protein